MDPHTGNEYMQAFNSFVSGFKYFYNGQNAVWSSTVYGFKKNNKKGIGIKQPIPFFDIKSLILFLIIYYAFKRDRYSSGISILHA